MSSPALTRGTTEYKCGDNPRSRERGYITWSEPTRHPHEQLIGLSIIDCDHQSCQWFHIRDQCDFWICFIYFWVLETFSSFSVVVVLSIFFVLVLLLFLRFLFSFSLGLVSEKTRTQQNVSIFFVVLTSSIYDLAHQFFIFVSVLNFCCHFQS